MDNDICIRRLSAEILVRFGYRVDAAADGEAAWQALNTDSYDLLITDHNMPKLSGVELLKKLRGARMALPVIMVSGRMPAEELNRQPWLQIDGRLHKPFTVEQFLGTVHEVLRAREVPSEQSAPPADWQSQPLAVAWQL